MEKELIAMIETLHPVLRRLDPRLLQTLGLKVETVVVDANVVFRDLRHAFRRGRPTILAEAMHLGYLRVFAPNHLTAEVKHHLPTLESKWKVPEGRLVELWRTQYVPYIQWIEVEPSMRRPLVAELCKRDPKDTPYVEVYERVGAGALLSTDNDIKDLGVAPPDWFQFAGASSQESRERHTVAVVYLGATVAVIGTKEIVSLATGAAVRLVRELITRFLRLPLAVQLAVLAAVAAILASPAARGKLKSLWEHALEDLSRGLRSLGEASLSVAQFVYQHENLAAEARDRKGLIARSPGAPVFAKDYVIRILADSERALTTQEVTRRTLESGYQTTSQRPERYIARVLASHPNVLHIPGEGWVVASGLAHPRAQLERI